MDGWMDGRTDGRTDGQRPLTPGFRQQLSDRRGSHLCEEGPAVNAAEVRQEAVEVEFVGNNAETSTLHES